MECREQRHDQDTFPDYLILIPVEAGYGKARGTYAHQPGVRVGSDDFTSTTAGGVLNARTAPVGGTWAVSGAATDLVFSDAFGGEQITRSATGIRYAILGTSTYTNVEVVATAERDGPPGASVSQGVIARWTDANNYVRAALSESTGFVGTTSTLSVTQVVAGVATVLGTTTVPTSTTGQLSLVAFTSGRVIAQSTGHSTYTVDVISVDVATGGTLATGKAGIYDTGAATVTRYYDAFSVVTPPSEPIALYSGRSLEIRHDSTERESSGGDTWGRPASYRGTRLWINPAGDQSRTTRVAVKASRNDLDSAEDANLTDQIALTVEVVPRFNWLPRLSSTFAWSVPATGPRRRYPDRSERHAVNGGSPCRTPPISIMRPSNTASISWRSVHPKRSAAISTTADTGSDV